ncbi:hypothetical protein YTPLAS18_29620 [Nitrospira sp.]|nr:hypothetical protein YTPLAS18_29620 [Nitrospira sp.]
MCAMPGFRCISRSLALCALITSFAFVSTWGAEYQIGSIDRSKAATLGILQPGEDIRSGASKTHFTMRGSGVHLGDGYLVTARHVVERDEEGRKVVPRAITVMTTNLEEATAELVGGSAFLDVVVYRMPSELAARIPSAAFDESDVVSGSRVYTIGYPMGWGPAIMFGHVGNPNTFLPTADTRLMQLDVGACSGNSGGGVFNESGSLVGIMHAIIQTDTVVTGDQRCSRFGFAVPSSLAKKVVSAVIGGSQPAFSRLGVGLTAVRVEQAWRIAVADVSGPAKDGGMRKGDVILAIDGTDIANGAQLKNYLIERTNPGQQISIKVLRDDREESLTVILGTS